MARRNWTRDELIVAFNLYCKLPFGQYHRRNPQVIELARLLRRTPDAVAMKLCNFASLDPTHQKRGVRGLGNSGKLDPQIWEEFNNNWEQLAIESERAVLKLKGRQPEPALLGAGDLPSQAEEVLPPTTGETEKERLIRVRLRQAFFRQTILASYGSACCVCGLPCEALLVASHIIPWSKRPDLRVNPRNGLCLCALHDRAFDRGLISVTPQFTLTVSPKLEAFLPDEVVKVMFRAYRGLLVHLPEKFQPEPEYLTYHHTEIYQAD
jgi:hypothetical protein